MSDILDLHLPLKDLNRINSIYSLTDIWAELLVNIKNSGFFPQLNEEETLYSEIELNCDLEDFYILDDYWNESVQELSDKIEDYPNWQKKHLHEGDELQFADAANSFEVNSTWVKPWYNIDSKTYSEVRGIDKFIKILTSDENLQYTHKKDNEWLRLIMPKNTRRVEVEDLNRNFWVIGQSTSIMLQYLFADDAPLKDILKRMLSEVTQLWNNVAYLWANYYSIMAESYTKIQIIFAPITHTVKSNHKPNDRLNAANTYSNRPYYYDACDMSGFKGRYDSTDYKNYFWEYIEKYPDSNLVIIPYHKNDNYKHNYFSQVIFPGILYFDRNQGAEKINAMIGQLDKQQGFIFKNFYSNFPSGESGVIVSLRNEDFYGKSLDLQSFIYGAQELDDGYRLLRPFSAGATIQEDNPSRYYGLLRFVPDIEAHYDNGIVIDKFEINFYDAARELLRKDLKPILTLTKNGEWSSRDKEDWNSKYEIIQTPINKKLEVSSPSNIYATVGEKYYMGDLLSWYTKTDERELLEIIGKIDIAGTGILIKIGNFLPAALLSDGSNNIKIATIKNGIGRENKNGNFVNFGGGQWEVRHQYHTISDKEVEPTAYELNLSFQNSGSAITTGNMNPYFSQEDCYYYYPVWIGDNNVNAKWSLKSLGTSTPTKEEIISYGLQTIKMYMEIGKEVRYKGASKIEESGHLENLLGSTLDYDKITYFIGCIGIYPWENSHQFYWSQNLLFGVFYYIPKSFINNIDNFKDKIEVNDKNGELKGYVIYSSLINKIERAFNIENDYYFTKKSTTDKTLYHPLYSSSSTWRLPKIYPALELSSAIQVQSNKQGDRYFSLTDKLLNLYEKKNYDAIYEYIRQGVITPLEKEEFIKNSVNKLLTENKGTWTVFDGNYIFDENINNEKENIHFYNSNNLVRQVAEVDFSIINGESEFSKVLLKKYEYNSNNGKVDKTKDEQYSWNYRNGDQDQVLSDQGTLVYDENGKNITRVKGIIANVDNATIDEAIWNNGVDWKISVFYEIQDKEIEQLKTDNGTIIYNEGVDLSAWNYMKGGNSSYNDFDDKKDWDLIDWEKLAKSNIKFVILRAAGTPSGAVDKAFEYSYSQAKKYGIPVGAYYFSYAITKENAENEAKVFANLLKDKQFEYPVFIDYEWITIDNTTDSARKRNGNSKVLIETFINKMKELGYCCGLYYNQGYNNSMNDDSLDIYVEELKKKKLAWQARYTSITDNNLENYCIKNGIWQYSDGKGLNNLSDIINDTYCTTDRDITCYDYPTYIKASGYNGYTAITNIKKIETISW